MRLFDDFEAVRFPEEGLILITCRKYLYYIYDPSHRRWQKHRNAGNDRLKVENYPDVSREELTEAMNGVFPTAETDLMRLFAPSQLWVWEMMVLLEEDYPQYMTDAEIRYAIHHFLNEAPVEHKAYAAVRELLDRAVAAHGDSSAVLAQVKDACFAMIGWDIFKDEIWIVDGYKGSSFFEIKPVRIMDYADTNDDDNVAELKGVEISIEEEEVGRYLAPFLYRYLDEDLEANKRRVRCIWTDENGNELTDYIEGFEWYLTHNFYTLDAMAHILEDIRDTAEALSDGRENGFTAELRKAWRRAPDAMIVDFYRRFLYRMEYMMTVGREKGYDLISFMGP